MPKQNATVVVYDPPTQELPHLVVLIWPDGTVRCAPAKDAITAQMEAERLAVDLEKEADAERTKGGKAPRCCVYGQAGRKGARRKNDAGTARGDCEEGGCKTLA